MKPDDLVMPFVVTRENGGTVDGHAFMLGWMCATLDAVLSARKLLQLQQYVHPDALPQLELIGKRYGYRLTTDQVDQEGDDQWVLVRFDQASKKGQ